MAAHVISEPDDTWNIVLAEVFVALPFAFTPRLACVSRRWRDLAWDPTWKPDLLLYSWGKRLPSGHVRVDADTADHGTRESLREASSFSSSSSSFRRLSSALSAADDDEARVDRPRLLACFYSPRPEMQVTQVACGDAYTLAVTRGGLLFEWGTTATLEPIRRPTRVPELDPRTMADGGFAVQASVTAPGYYHDRAHNRHHAAVVTRDGSVWAWGSNVLGESSFDDPLRAVVLAAAPVPRGGRERGGGGGASREAEVAAARTFSSAHDHTLPPYEAARNFFVLRPRRVTAWDGTDEVALAVGCGVNWTVVALAPRERGGGGGGGGPSSSSPSSSPSPSAAPLRSRRVVEMGGLMPVLLRRPHPAAAAAAAASSYSSASASAFRRGALREVGGLRGRRLLALAVGGFAACALVRPDDDDDDDGSKDGGGGGGGGEKEEGGFLWSWGDPFGPDQANGCLLGRPPPHDPAMAARVHLPSAAAAAADGAEVGRGGGSNGRGGGGGDDHGGGAPMSPASPRPPPPPPWSPPRPVRCVRIAASTYSFAAVGCDGRCFTWGDSDGGALGHAHPLRVRCDAPTPVDARPSAGAAGQGQRRGSYGGWERLRGLLGRFGGGGGGEEGAAEEEEEEATRGIGMDDGVVARPPAPAQSSSRRRPPAANSRLRRPPAEAAPPSADWVVRSASVSYTNGALVVDHAHPPSLLGRRRRPGTSERASEFGSDEREGESEGEGEGDFGGGGGGGALGLAERRRAAPSFAGRRGGRLLLFGGLDWTFGLANVAGSPAHVPHNAAMRELLWQGLGRGYVCEALMIGQHHAFIIARKEGQRRAPTNGL